MAYKNPMKATMNPSSGFMQASPLQGLMEEVPPYGQDSRAERMLNENPANLRRFREEVLGDIFKEDTRGRLEQGVKDMREEFPKMLKRGR